MLRHHGDRVWCPACGHTYDRFKDDWNRRNAICWRCGSHERHRALALLLDRRPELLANARALLHFAPEWCLQRRLKTGGYRYVTADLDQPGVDLHLDITRMAGVPDDDFDAVICSHVLEHVEDDAAAMRELRRITAADGWCLVMVPIDIDRERTHEDRSITAHADRERECLQFDHVRLYAPDIQERLAGAGFDAQRIDPTIEFGEATLHRCRLLPADLIWLCR